MKKALRSEAELESVDARLEEMDRKLDRLRSLYESFFMGTERTPPNAPRRDLNRMMMQMQQQPIGNATVRFRFQSMVQRWVLLTSYWNRTLREIELGTYRRDLAKAHRHLSERGAAMTEAEARRLGIPESRLKAFVGRQQVMAEKRAQQAGSKPEASPADARPTPRMPLPAVAAAKVTPSDVPGLAAGELEAFYDRYVEAHREAALPPPKASLGDLRAKLQKELPRLIGDKGGRVVLDVAVEAGRVRLKARPAK